jgi:hypothetical protein
VRVNRLGSGVLLCGLLALTCAHASPAQRRAQEDGTYRVDCGLSLARCLASIEEVCGQGYDIVQGREDRVLSGPQEPNEPRLTSVVVARCRTASSLWGGSEKPSPPAASGGAAPPVSSRSCTPGATQACFGPGACHGGQQCLADGMSFGPCDCGTAAPAAPAVSPAAPDGGAAPPR